MLRRIPRSETASKRSMWLVLVIAVVAFGALVATGCSTSVGGPEGAAERMFAATAAYDAQGILDNSTHASMTATDIVAFKKQAADQKTVYKDVPFYKDIKVVSTTYPDPKDKNTAVVKVSLQWLSDPKNGTYTQRNETLTVLLQKGTWLVKLY